MTDKYHNYHEDPKRQTGELTWLESTGSGVEVTEVADQRLIGNGGSANNRVTMIELPRDLYPGGVIGALYAPPDELKKALPMTPDHVREARVDCVYEFLETTLLPRMLDESEITAEELVSLASDFKFEFRKDHPKDLIGEFELIASTELRLMHLHIHYKSAKIVTGEWPEEAEVVERTMNEIRSLLDRHPEDLYPI